MNNLQWSCKSVSPEVIHSEIVCIIILHCCFFHRWYTLASYQALCLVSCVSAMSIGMVSTLHVHIHLPSPYNSHQWPTRILLSILFQVVTTDLPVFWWKPCVSFCGSHSVPLCSGHIAVNCIPIGELMVVMSSWQSPVFHPRESWKTFKPIMNLGVVHACLFVGCFYFLCHLSLNVCS